MVLVKKMNDKWQIYIYFIDLNKVCPKDNYLLLRIDQLVNLTTRNGILCFMDAYSGYNKILIFYCDEEYTIFITDRGLLQGNAFWT